MIKVFEAFAGIGTQRMALRNLGIDHEVVAIAEIDKYAIASYEAIHGDVNNLGDISKIKTEDIPDHDLFTYSFPCQDISVAGKQAGFKEGSGTRSGLLWECEKVIEIKRPKYLLMENVKNLVGKKFKPDFDKWLERLEELGYSNYWQVLNAKDYGIPQNRERVFCVSILGEHKPYAFPEPIPLEIRLKDLLEDEVDEKFYLSEEKTQQLVTSVPEKHSEKTVVKMNRHEVKGENELANTLLARDYKGFGNQDMNGVIEPVIAASRGRNPDNPSDRTPGSPTEQRLEVNQKGTSNTITTVQKDNYVVEPLGTLAAHNSDKFGTGYMDGVSKTLKANKHDISVMYNNYSIRKLTPKECWRLMGCSDEDFEKAQQVNSNSQLYKQAGNAIVVDVLYHLFKELFIKAGK